MWPCTFYYVDYGGYKNDLRFLFDFHEFRGWMALPEILDDPATVKNVQRWLLYMEGRLNLRNPASYAMENVLRYLERNWAQYEAWFWANKDNFPQLPLLDE